MSKVDILEELPKLAPVDRQEIEWLDNCNLTDDEKRLLEQRLAAIENNPNAGSSWEEVEARIRTKLRR